MPQTVAGIAWPQGGTVGHITVTSALISGTFAASDGNDGRVDCSLAPAGKYRNGARRAWCRTHQQYWGVKADLAAFAASGVYRCASHQAPMGYVIAPLLLELASYASMSISYGMDGMQLAAQPHAAPPWRATVAACAILCDRAAPLFGDPAIVQVNLTPPALQALAEARRSGQQIGCVNCARCGHPHLDLGSFAVTSHRRHYCGNCGHDATHSPHALVSNPLHALLAAHAGRLHI